jgi:holo-[acyl-carrier protein] synthase
MIAGIGTDIVQISRIQDILNKDQERFLRKLFLDSEYEVAKSKNFNVEHIAGRWACKESISKALGTGIGQKCNFHDIEIYYNENGQPEVALLGNAATTAQQQDIFRIKISISHEKHYAVAFAIAVT